MPLGLNRMALAAKITASRRALLAIVRGESRVEEPKPEHDACDIEIWCGGRKARFWILALGIRLWTLDTQYGKPISVQRRRACLLPG